MEELVVQVDLVASAEPVARVAQVALAEPVSQVALAALVSQAARVEPVARVVLAVLVVPAVGPELNRAEPERDLVEVELARDPVAAPVKTKSGTAARHRGLVLVPKRVEDMAVVAAATTREPAATEVARAWVAAE